MKSKLIVYLDLIFGVFALSSSAVFAKSAAAPSAVTAFYRLFFASLILSPFLFFNHKNKEEFKNLSKSQWKLGLTSGIFLAIHYILWFESLKLTSAANSTVFATMQPLYSMAGERIIYKKKFDRKAIWGVLTALIGCGIIAWGDFQLSPRAILGDLLALISAGFITAYFFVGKKVRKNLDVVPYSIIGYSGASIFLAIYSLCFNYSFLNYSRHTWLCFIGLALVSTVMGQMMFNWLLKWLSPTDVTVSILGETIGTCILAWIFLHEGISLLQAAGILVILLGIGIFMVEENKRKARNPSLE